MARKSTSNARRKARAASAERADKSLDQFRSALERSLTLSRERIEEVMDDAVKRGRMTRSDANELVTHLVDRGRKQTEDLVKDVESALKQLRDDLSSRAESARNLAQEVIGKASGGAVKPKAKPKRRAPSTKPRDRSSAKPKASAPRKAAGSSAKGGAGPIANYDSLGVADVRKRLAKLSAADLRAVRAAEKKGKNRKTVLADIDKRLP